MRELILEAAGWKSADDFYDAFFAAVGAPDWHGRNFDALNDSIAGGDINMIEVPYRIVITNASQADTEAKNMIERFTSLIQKVAANGCPVEIEHR